MGEVKNNSNISRRDFLKLGIFGAASAAIGLSKAREWLRTPNVVWPQPEVVEKEKKDDMGLGELGKERSEFSFIWPAARVWTAINTVLAAEILDGVTLEKGKEYSLANLVGLYDAKRNFDPRKGYVSGILLRNQPPFVALVDAYGLCLTATSLGRALASSPVKIYEWNTHLWVDSVTANYFRSENKINSKPIFDELGTDITVMTSPDWNLDFRFEPLEDLQLKGKIMDSSGKQLSSLNFDQVLELMGVAAYYPASLTKRFPTPIMVRYAVGSKNLEDYQIDIGTSLKSNGEKEVPGVNRMVRRNGELLSNESFSAFYGVDGKSIFDITWG